jgi:UDP-N-acetylglucosamine--N-acetylmuramyl-(pentapeptide) pyrophosphoryl-undecaprenol N-acetylglucosamine transferase
MSDEKRNIKVLIACGGTGGHIFPGIAIGQAIARAKPDASIIFAGTQRGLEETIVPKMGWRLVFVGSTSIKDRKGVFRTLAYLRLPFSILGAIRVLRREKPDVLIGIGGYAAGPLTLAGSIMKIPTAIVEPNAVAGFTNRILGKFAKRIYIGFSEASPFFPEGKVMLAGNPVRQEIAALRRVNSSNHVITTIFCFGGSQGALAVNRAMISALPYLAQGKKKIRFIHQVGGREDIESVKDSYRKYGFEAEVFKFTDKIWESYSSADLIVARAGAATVAEIAVIGIPAIFIPYPYAADNHQKANAMAVERCGGAIVIPQQELTGERLASEIMKLSPDRLAMMQAALVRYGRPDAADKIALDCLKLIGSKTNV